MGRGDKVYSSSSSRSKDSSSKKSRKRSRSRSPKRRRSRSKSPSRTRKSGFRGKSPPSRKKEKKAEDGPLDINDVIELGDKDLQEAKLEEEMQKRRERIQAWQKDRKIAQSIEESRVLQEEEDADAGGPKKWSLEDEDEDDAADADDDGVKKEPKAEPKAEPESEAKPEEPDEKMREGEEAAEQASEAPPTDEAEKKAEEPAAAPVEAKKEEPNAEEEEDDEIDPLDAFMVEVNKEVRTKMNRGRGSTVTKIVTVTKDAAKAAAKEARIEAAKGDVLEQDADALEYSDEEAELTLEATMSLATKARQLAITDHSRVYYRPFRRDFFVEVPEQAKMTQEEVEAFREELGSIKVRGKNCPKPLKSWAHSGSTRSVLDVMKRLGYDTPTPIQAQAVPAIMSGRDVIGIAKTGSGKTLAFLLPLFRHIMDQEELDEGDGPIAVIMSPTRELALQTAKEARKFAKRWEETESAAMFDERLSNYIASLALRGQIRAQREANRQLRSRLLDAQDRRANAEGRLRAANAAVAYDFAHKGALISKLTTLALSPQAALLRLLFGLTEGQSPDQLRPVVEAAVLASARRRLRPPEEKDADAVARLEELAARLLHAHQRLAHLREDLRLASASDSL